MKNKLLLAILSLGISGAAFANPTTEVTSEEKPKMERHFDGKHKHGEKHGKKGHRQNPHTQHMKKMWELTDADKDGKISKAEALAAAGAKFDKLDKNGDGYVTKEEMKELHKEMMKKFPKHDGKKHGPKGERKAPPAPKADVEVTGETK